MKSLLQGRLQTADVVCSLVACYSGNSLLQMVTSGAVTWGLNIVGSIVFTVLLQALRIGWTAFVDQGFLRARIRHRYRWEQYVLLSGCYIGCALIEEVRHSTVTWGLNIVATAVIMLVYVGTRAAWSRATNIVRRTDVRMR